MNEYQYSLHAYKQLVKYGAKYESIYKYLNQQNYFKGIREAFVFAAWIGFLNSAYDDQYDFKQDGDKTSDLRLSYLNEKDYASVYILMLKINSSLNIGMLSHKETRLKLLDEVVHYAMGGMKLLYDEIFVDYINYNTVIENPQIDIKLLNLLKKTKEYKQSLTQFEAPF